MFSVFRSTFPKALIDDVELHDSIELETFIPWFLCEVVEYDEINNCSVATMHFVTSIDSLISICHYYDIKQIYLVSPAYLNKSDVWKIDLLHSIRTSTYLDDDVNRTIYKFVLMNGNDLIYGQSEPEKMPNKVAFDLLIDFEQLKMKSDSTRNHL